MSDETIAKLFEPYFTTKANGTGLGMTMVYKIVKEFSGEILVDSKENEGTKLKVERGGRVFPESDKSSDIIKALSKKLSKAKVDIRLNSKVTDVFLENDIIKTLTKVMSIFQKSDLLK